MLALLRYTFAVTGRRCTEFLVLAVVQAALAAILTLLTGAVLGRGTALADGGSANGLYAEVGVLAVVLLVAALLPLRAQLVWTDVRTQLQADVDSRILDVLLRPRGVGHLADPVVADRLKEAEGIWEPVSHGGAAWLYLLQARMTGVGVAVVIATHWRWWTVFPLFASTLWVEWLVGHGALAPAEVRSRNTDAHRRVDYAFDLGTDGAAGNEIRVFGFAGWLVRRYRDSSHDLLVPQWRARRRAARRWCRWYATRRRVGCRWRPPAPACRRCWRWPGRGMAHRRTRWPVGDGRMRRFAACRR